MLFFDGILVSACGRNSVNTVERLSLHVFVRYLRKLWVNLGRLAAPSCGPQLDFGLSIAPRCAPC